MRHWSKSDDRILRRLYPGHHRKVIAARLRRTDSAIKSRAEKLKIKKICGRKPWTASDYTRLREIYPDLPCLQVAKLLGRTLNSIHAQAGLLHLQKSKTYLAALRIAEGTRLSRSGAPTRFKPGLIPHNKGLRRPGYSLTHGRMAETTFKKGQRSRNWFPVGTIKADSDGYLRKKITDRGLGGFGNQKVWEFIHVRIWKEGHGPVPPGHAVVFKDGDKQNTVLSNLECISRAELMRRNSIHRPSYPPELRKVILLTGALKRQIRERKEKYGKQQKDVRLARSSVRRARKAKRQRQSHAG